jgi:hypothetical protein
MGASILGYVAWGEPHPVTEIPPQTASAPRPRRRDTVSDKVRAANRRNLEKSQCRAEGCALPACRAVSGRSVGGARIGSAEIAIAPVRQTVIQLTKVHVTPVAGDRKVVDQILYSATGTLACANSPGFTSLNLRQDCLCHTNPEWDSTLAQNPRAHAAESPLEKTPLVVS